MKLFKLLLIGGLLFFVVLGFSQMYTRSAFAEGGRSDICGDANDDELVNVLDVSFLINYLYKGGQQPSNMANCDVDNSGRINLLDITDLVNFLYKSGPDLNCGESISGNVSGNTTCKSFPAKADYPSNVDCLEWNYTGDWQLDLKHINSAFNCCPIVHANFYLWNDTIIIEEYETFDTLGPCYCLCLFDVDYTISGLTPGEYFVKIIGMNLYPGDDTLMLSIDLTQEPQGSYCVTRDHYPWGMTDPAIHGELIDRTGCLSFDTKDSTLEEDCITYDYGADSTLLLSHLNDVFNCCPESLYATINIEANVIEITEYETDGLCDCLCLFNLDYAIYNLPPGTWTIRVDNPYYYELHQVEPIEFEVELTPGTNGYFCVDRFYLPGYY